MHYKNKNLFNKNNKKILFSRKNAFSNVFFYGFLVILTRKNNCDIFLNNIIGVKICLENFGQRILIFKMNVGKINCGRRIVKTMGQRVAKLRPVDGLCAETSAASSFFISTACGIPVNTTHTGEFYKKIFSGKKGCSRKKIWAWIITIPVAAFVSWVSYIIFKFVFLKTF